MEGLSWSDKNVYGLWTVSQLAYNGCWTLCGCQMPASHDSGHLLTVVKAPPFCFKGWHAIATTELLPSMYRQLVLQGRYLWVFPHSSVHFAGVMLYRDLLRGWRVGVTGRGEKQPSELLRQDTVTIPPTYWVQQHLQLSTRQWASSPGVPLTQ